MSRSLLIKGVVAMLATAALAGSDTPRGFTLLGVSNRLVTAGVPAVFSFTNTRDSAGEIKIYDVRGKLVTTIAINPGDTSESWRGQVAGQPVRGGIYIYVLKIEDTVISGSLVVVR
jgi:hypothetical protein